MSLVPSDREIEAVGRLDGPMRYQYFLGKVSDWEEIWSIRDDDGWSLMADEQGREAVPVWPAEAFASRCCTGEWAGQRPDRISLSDWLENWLPGMAVDGRLACVFPLVDGRGVVVEPERLEADLRESLESYE